jgi:hypothetical protein
VIVIHAPGGSVHTFDEVDELDVSRHIATPGSHIVAVESLGSNNLVELFAHTSPDGVCEQFHDRLDRFRRERVVGCRDRRTPVEARRLQARKWLAFSGTVHANDGLEEEAVSELPGLGALVAHRERSIERLPDVAFVLWPNPDEYERGVASVQRSLRCLDDRAVQAVAVCEYARRREHDYG